MFNRYLRTRAAAAVTLGLGRNLVQSQNNREAQAIISTNLRFCSNGSCNSVGEGSAAEKKLTKKEKKKGTLHPSNLKKEPAPSSTSVSSSSSSSWFARHREKTLRDLAANNNDKSNAGRVDPLILPAVNLINSYPHYCTASSCSGRVSVFHRAMPAKPSPVSSSSSLSSDARESSDRANITSDASVSTAGSADHPQSMDVTLANKKRGLGIGTVFSSHDPLGSDPSDTRRIAVGVYKALVRGGVPTMMASGNANGGGAELLQIKFEPTILHTTCASLEDAHRFIAASSESGHRSTGIVVSRASNHHHHNNPTNTVARAQKDPAAGDAAAAIVNTNNDVKSTSDTNSNSNSNTNVFDAVNDVDEAAANASCDEGDAHAIDSQWKITAKMQSMVCFDAPVYNSNSGWLLHGGHEPLPDVFGVMSSSSPDGDATSSAAATAATQLPVDDASLLDAMSVANPSTSEKDKALALAFIGHVDRLLSHGNALFAENEARRGRFIATLRTMEAAAAAKKKRKY